VTVPDRARWRERAAVGALAIAATLLALLGAEGLLRLLPLASVQRLQSRQQARPGARAPHPRGLYRLHPVVGWTLAPGYAGRFEGGDFAIAVAASADGLRDRDFGPKPPGTVRILGLGDSFAFGWGVESDESLFKVLEKRLDAAAPGRYEVVNAGIPGFGTYESLQMLHWLAPRYDPDLVVLAFYEGNDYHNNGDAPRVRVIEDGYLRDAPASAGGPWRTLRGKSVLAALADAGLSGLARKRRFASDVARTRALLGEMKASLDARGAPLVVLFIPDQDPESYRRPAPLRAYDRLASGLGAGEARQALRAYCGDHGIAWCALSARFEGEDARLRLADTHFNARGHAEAAGELLTCLRAHLPGAHESAD
jgi:hypothetical protein